MKLELNEVVFSNGDWKAEELGTLVASLENTDKVKFAKIKADKQIVVLITEKGKDAPNKHVVCSKNVSNAIRAAVAKGASKKALLRTAINLEVIKNDTGFFLAAPKGDIGESFSVADIKKAEEVELFNPEELIA